MKDERGSYEEIEGGEESLRVAEGGEDLRKRTKRFSLGVVSLFVTLPRAPVEQVLGKQLLRSATSVGANYREACRSRSDQEFIAKLGGCLKELDETSHWLELLGESGLFPTDKFSPLLLETNELLAIFTSIAKAQKAKLNANNARPR